MELQGTVVGANIVEEACRQKHFFIQRFRHEPHGARKSRPRPCANCQGAPQVRCLGFGVVCICSRANRQIIVGEKCARACRIFSTGTEIRDQGNRFLTHVITNPRSYCLQPSPPQRSRDFSFRSYLSLYVTRWRDGIENAAQTPPYSSKYKLDINN